MNILQTEWWSIAIAPEWWTEREEDAVLIGDRDEVGSIQISSLFREEGEFPAEESQGRLRLLHFAGLTPKL